MDANRKEAIRAGVIAKLKREGRYTGEFVKTDKVCANESCKAVFKPHKSAQTHCSIACRRKYHTQEERLSSGVRHVVHHRRNRKVQAVAYLGGKCIKCGYTKSVAALDFHHRDPTKKDFGISSGAGRSWEKLRVELDKCDLLCANCHREVHEELDLVG